MSQKNHSNRSRAFLAALVTGSVVIATPAWGQVINEDRNLLASDRELGDHFGYATAIDNGIIAAGARHHDHNGTSSGSAYVFDASTGAQIAELLASDGAANNLFGGAITIDNGVVGVGAIGHGDSGSFSGAAYLFDASTGVQTAKLLASDGAADDYFGWSVAIGGGVVAVGAPRDDDSGDMSGAAYLFDVSTGVQLAKLLPDDGAAADQFGFSIAIDGGIVAVGAWLHADNGNASGAVYLFDASTGVQTGKLLASDGASNDWFGRSLAIDGGIVAIGAEGDDDGASGTGSVYLFDASTGTQLAKLHASDAGSFDQFGFSVSISNGIVAVGANLDDDDGTSSGSAYLFDASTGDQIVKLLPSIGLGNYFFGTAIGIDNGVVAVGADGFIQNSGTVYVFTAPGADCPADLNDDGTVNTLDFLAFLNLWTAGDPVSDWNADGSINTLDFLAYLNDWVAGC